MKRGAPLERRTPLQAKCWGIRQDPAETRRRRARDGGIYRDPAYLVKVKGLTCVAATVDGQNCAGPIDPHHAGAGLAHPDPECRKTCDRTAVPICRAHHRAVECFEGYFKHWDAATREAAYWFWIRDTRTQIMGTSG